MITFHSTFFFFFFFLYHVFLQSFLQFSFFSFFFFVFVFFFFAFLYLLCVNQIDRAMKILFFVSDQIDRGHILRFSVSIPDDNPLCCQSRNRLHTRTRGRHWSVTQHPLLHSLVFFFFLLEVQKKKRECV